MTRGHGATARGRGAVTRGRGATARGRGGNRNTSVTDVKLRIGTVRGRGTARGSFRGGLRCVAGLTCVCMCMSC